jgi:5-methylthioadenosine/S-adenosylhomocysteine deaminase
MKDCDLLISAPWTLPVAPENTLLEDHCLAVTAGEIVGLAPRQKLLAEYRPAELIELDRHILLPGLVNAHGHGAMSLLRGAGEDQPLKTWLNETIWPMEAQLVNADFVRLGTELAIAEMLLSGTTTFSDMYFFPEVAAEVSANLGIRAQIAFPIIEFANVWSENVTDALHLGLAVNDTYRHHPLINVALGPHAAYSLSAQEMEKVGMYANELEIGVQIHLHETADEVQQALSDHGQSWIARLHEIGMLGPHLQAVHMTQVTPDELGLIAATHTNVVHCPTSNLKLASGYCATTELQVAGVCVALGTDGAASNNRLDMFDEARLAALLAKHQRGDAAAGDAPTVLQMATLDGARALGIDDITGSLEVGKRADFITVDVTSLGMLPMYNPYACLIHGNAGNAVDNVFVDGRALVRDSALTLISQAELAQRVQSWHGGISRGPR